MSLTKLSRLCVVLTCVSISALAVGCGSPASTPSSEPAATSIPAGEQPEAGSTTGGAGAEVPEGGEEAKKEEAGT